MSNVWENNFINLCFNVINFTKKWSNLNILGVSKMSKIFCLNRIWICFLSIWALQKPITLFNPDLERYLHSRFLHGADIQYLAFGEWRLCPRIMLIHLIYFLKSLILHKIIKFPMFKGKLLSPTLPLLQKVRLRLPQRSVKLLKNYIDSWAKIVK